MAGAAMIKNAVGPPSCNSPERIETLEAYRILDTPPERAFDEITELAASLCNAPMAVITLVDAARQWFKSEVGVGVRETPIESSICAHAIREPEMLVVEDTLKDERFAKNPFVTGSMHLRFYAGAVLRAPN